MPVQSQARPTVTPSTAAAPTTGQAPAGGGRLDRMQRTLGNQAVQERLKLGAAGGQEGDGGPPGGAIGEGVASAQAALRQNTDHASVTARGRLAKNAAFADADGNALLGKASTTFEVGVSRSRAWARFTPEVLLVPGNALAKAATGGIGLSELSFDFRTGKPSLTCDLGFAGDLLDPFLGIQDFIERAFADAVSGALPADLRGGDYDPYTDPELPQRLASVAAALSTSFPGRPEDFGGRGLGAEDMLARIDKPELVARVDAKAAAVPLDPRTKLRLGEGASLELTVRLDGTLGDALQQPTLRELVLVTDDLTLEDVDTGLLGGLELHKLALGPDLSVRELDYTLGAETALVLMKAFGDMARPYAAAQPGAVQAPPTQALRDKIDASVRVELPRMLRDQVRRVAGEMPGLPLAQLLGPGQG